MTNAPHREDERGALIDSSRTLTSMIRTPTTGARFAPPDLEIDRRADGTVIVRSAHALADYPERVGDWLEHWAAATPDKTFLAERNAEGAWRRVSFGETRAQTHALAQALLDRDLGPKCPVLTLSDNSVDQGLLMLAAMHVGVPFVPVSPAYSLMVKTFEKLAGITDLVAPGLVFAQDGEAYGRALASVDFKGAEIVSSVNSAPGAGTLSALSGTRPTAAVDAAFQRTGPDTVAKILFTSGSTGNPKGVINTQRMLTSNQGAISRLWPFLDDRPPVLVDWLPWSHTFGSNHNFNMMLAHGGTLHIDAGKPVPGRIEQTVANLAEISPTLYFNVPRGYDTLLPFLESDADFCRSFFAELDLIFYAAAALPRPLWDRLDRLAREVRGAPLPFISAWGATETAPMATAVHYPITGAGNIGLPGPGTELKLVQTEDKLEIRVRGPNVTPGYWDRPDLSNEAFDEEGFYLTGDAVAFVDPDDPRKGLAFGGRISEDFKLTSGTWVHVGALRVDVIAAGAGVIQDCVITGEGQEEVGVLVFASPAVDPNIPETRIRLAEGLARHNRDNPASSRRISRALILSSPPSIDAGEITDKGYINQRAVLNERTSEVSRLHASDDPDVIVID